MRDVGCQSALFLECGRRPWQVRRALHPPRAEIIQPHACRSVPYSCMQNRTLVSTAQLDCLPKTPPSTRWKTCGTSSASANQTVLGIYSNLCIYTPYILRLCSAYAAMSGRGTSMMVAPHRPPASIEKSMQHSAGILTDLGLVYQLKIVTLVQMQIYWYIHSKYALWPSTTSE